MSESQRWFLLAIGLVLVGLVYLLAPILTPFLAASILAYIGDPIADKLEARGMTRTLSVVTVFSVLTLVLLILLLILIPSVQGQVKLLISHIPRYIAWLQEQGLPALGTLLGYAEEEFGVGELKSYLGDMQGAGGALGKLLALLGHSGQTLLHWVANLTLIPVVTFYMLRDWDLIVARVQELLPRYLEPRITRLARESDEVLGAFFRGQLLVMLALGTLYSIGLAMVGLDLSLLIGMLAGLVSFVPYLGAITGILVAGLAAIMQFHDLLHLVLVALVFGVGQAVEGMLLTPLLVGEKIGLHPVAVLFAVLAGGQLFGFFGILLALPVAAVVMVLLRYAHQRYRHSELYGEGCDEQG